MSPGVPGLLEDSTAVVTGASRGIGAAIATALAGSGAAVGLISRTPAPLQDLADELRAATGSRVATAACDVSDSNAVRAAVAKLADALGTADVLVNNAGLIERADSVTLAADAWERVLDTNLRAAFVAAQSAFPAMRDSGGGAIVNVGSLSGTFGIRRAAAYGASKAGLLGLTRALALEWGPHGVRVNAVTPGYVATDFTRALVDDPERFESVRQRIPLGRWAQPHDIAGTVVYLASSLASYVTGQVVHVDGGYTVDG